MKIAGTGHRSAKLGGYSIEAFEKLVSVATQGILTYKPTLIISGMALGWDQALAVAAIRMDIQFIAAVPFYGQETAWPERSRKLYHRILDRASLVHYVTPTSTYRPELLQVRNEWMVDNCDLVLAMWDGSSGGTANCIQYANEVGKPYINMYENWRSI